MSIILRIGAVSRGIGPSGSGSDIHWSHDDDAVEIPPPPEDICRPPPTYASCYGLPYQDHTYGAPPPPTPPQSPSPVKIINGHVEVEEVVTTTTTASTGTSTSVVLPLLKDDKFDDSVTRCVCRFQHDDGYMICCDKCSVWQHIDCMGIERNNIPESFFCELCEPRVIDVERARRIQMKKREEMTDTSATDTDPDEAANHLASLNKKSMSPTKGKVVKQRRISKAKDKTSPKKLVLKKEKKMTKKEKENLGKELNKKKIKLAKDTLQKPPRIIKKRRKSAVSFANDSDDPWNSMYSPWIDPYEEVKENHYSAGMREMLSLPKTNGVLSDSPVLEKLLVQLCIVTDVKNNRKGLIAKEMIPQGQAVIEYKGNVMLREHLDEEKLMKKLHPFLLFYTKFEQFNLCVDASSHGGDSRFLRRSCTPNSEVQHIIEKNNIHFIIFSKKDIPKGGEITIPFDYSFKQCSFTVECACLKATCPVSRYFKKLRNPPKELPVKAPAPAPSPIPVPVPPSPSPSPSPVKEKKRTRRFSAPEGAMTRTKSKPVPKSPGTPVASPTKQQDTRRLSSAEEPSPVKMEPLEAKSAVVLSPSHDPTAATSEGQLSSESDLEYAERQKKMTREERKMEAIMKAFEKLAKREERRKEALARLDTTKKPDGKDDEPPPPPPVVSPPVAVKAEPDEKHKPESPTKATPTKGKKNKRQARSTRRTRVNSAAAVMEMATSADENSNMGFTPLPVPATADIGSTNAAGFKYHKTKKHLFNEWMIEKGTDSKPVPASIGKTEPLEVNVDDTMFVACLPSPRNAMEHIPRRNSQSTGSSAPPVVIPQPKTSNEHSIGSAKKRWLRQAMFETGPPSSDSGSASPVHHGGASPNPAVCLPSPGGSPPTDFVTPLKKRRLARESMSQEQPPTPSTPSPSVGHIADDVAAITIPGSPRTDLEELQNKNGIKPILAHRPVATEDLHEQIRGPPAKRLRRESSLRDSTDIESESESLLSEPSVHGKDNKQDFREQKSASVNKEDSAIESMESSSADSSVLETECRTARAGIFEAISTSTSDVKETSSVQSVANKEQTNSGSVAQVERNSLEQDSKCEETEDSLYHISLNKDVSEASGEICSSQGFEVSGIEEGNSQKTSEVTKPEEILSSAAEKDCISIDSRENICDSASKEDASCVVGNTDLLESTASPCKTSVTETSCTVSSTEAEIPKPPDTSTAAASVSSCVNVAVPDSQSGPSEASTALSNHLDDENSAMSYDDVTSSTNTDLHSSPGTHPAVSQTASCADISVQDDISRAMNPPLPLEPPPPLPPEEVTAPPPLPPSPPPPPPPPEPPTKKKVSLLEYRKRLKEKVPTSPTSISSAPPPPPPPMRSTTHHGGHRRRTRAASTPQTPTLAPLPLFKSNSPTGAKGVNVSPLKPDKKKEKEVRKPMSLTERLKQEFGLDDTEEEETNNKADEDSGSQSPEVPPPPPTAPHPSQLKPRSALLPTPPPNGGHIPPIMPPMGSFPNMVRQPGPITGIPPIQATNGPAHRNFPILNGTSIGQPSPSPSPVLPPQPVPPPAPVPAPGMHPAGFHGNKAFITAPTPAKGSPAFSTSTGSGYSPVQHPNTPPPGLQQPVQYLAQVQTRPQTPIGQKFEYNHGLKPKPVHSPPSSSSTWNKQSNSQFPPVHQATKDKGYHSPVSNYPSSSNHY